MSLEYEQLNNRLNLLFNQLSTGIIGWFASVWINENCRVTDDPENMEEEFEALTEQWFMNQNNLQKIKDVFESIIGQQQTLSDRTQIDLILIINEYMQAMGREDEVINYGVDYKTLCFRSIYVVGKQISLRQVRRYLDYRNHQQ